MYFKRIIVFNKANYSDSQAISQTVLSTPTKLIKLFFKQKLKRQDRFLRQVSDPH